MKKIILLSIFYTLCQTVQAQLVTTVAGQVEIPGSNDGPAFEANFNNPHGIAVGIDGVAYTADRWSHIIRKIALDGSVTTFAGSSGVSGAIDGQGTAALFHEPWGLCVDAAGNVYVADTRNNKIRKITPDGMVTTVAGSGNFGTSDGFGTSATFGNPTGIEIDAQGNLYVADHLTHIIRKIDAMGLVTTIAGKPYQMGDSDGQGTASRFKRPYGLSLDLDGNILVADEWNHTIRRVTPEGLVSTVAGNGTIGNEDGSVDNASFNYPWDISVDSLGNIFVADGYNYTIRKISPAAQVSTYAGAVEQTGATDGIGAEARFSGATAIAFSPYTQELFVGDAYNHLVRKITDLNQDVSLALLNASNQICLGEPVSLNAYPNIFDSYYFYVDNEIVQSSSSAFFETTNLTAGTHVIQVYAVENTSTNPSNEITITVLAPETPTITMIGSPEFFEGDSVVLFASFGAEYFWSTGETTASITVKESGTYTVEVVDENTCNGISDPVEIIVTENLPDAEVFVQGATTLCANESTALQSNAGEGNQWLRDGWAIDGATDVQYTVTTAGNYQVQVTHPNGVVVISEPVPISVLDDFEVDFVATATEGTVGQNFQFEIKQAEVTSAEWFFGDSQTSRTLNPSHAYTETGSFTVQLIATNAATCKDTVTKVDYMQIKRKDSLAITATEEAIVFIPTAFTPNADGENDVFYVRGEILGETNLTIFNQWGELIFTADGIEKGWDGTVRNSAAQNGTYVYVFEYTNSKGEQKLLSGHITLIR
ncbi:MAG: gliding motility-associated C-terminal domain-containing protein [Saprospiraceae bacterium]